MQLSQQRIHNSIFSLMSVGSALVSCGIHNDFIFLPNWLKNNSNIFGAYFLSKTMTARPQKKKSECCWKALQANCSLFGVQNHAFTGSMRVCIGIYVCVCVYVWVWVSAAVFSSVDVCVSLSAHGKSIFLRPENNWPPEPLWVVHPYEVRVKSDQHQQTLSTSVINGQLQQNIFGLWQHFL